MTNISVEDVERAVVQLSRSEKGVQAMRDLLGFLENGGTSLDEANQLSILCLLSGAWGKYAGTVREALRVMVNPRVDLPQNQPARVERAST